MTDKTRFFLGISAQSYVEKQCQIQQDLQLSLFDIYQPDLIAAIFFYGIFPPSQTLARPCLYLARTCLQRK